MPSASEITAQLKADVINNARLARPIVVHSIAESIRKKIKTMGRQVSAISTGGTLPPPPPPPPPPQAPVGVVTISDITSISYRITWDPPASYSTLTGYRIHEGTSPDISLSSTNEFNNPAITTLLSSGRVPNTKYYIWVFSLYGSNSSTSSTAEVTTPRLPPPTEFSTTNIASTTIDVTWTAPIVTLGYSIASYKLYHSSTPPYDLNAQTTTLTPTPNPFVFPLSSSFNNLIASTTYKLWISAVFTKDGTSEITQSIAVSIPSPVTTTSDSGLVSVAPVGDLFLTTPRVTPRHLEVNWPAYTESPPTGYEFGWYSLFISDSNSRPDQPVGIDIIKSHTKFTFTTTASAGIITPLESDTRYYVWVQVVWIDSVSFAPETSEAKTTDGFTSADINAPAPEEFSLFNINENQLDVSWKSPLDSSYDIVKNYILYLGETDNISYARTSPVVLEPTIFNYKFGGTSGELLSNTRYYIWLYADYTDGASGVVSFFTPAITLQTALIPKIETLALAEATSSSIKVSWADYSGTSVSQSTFAGFKVYISQNAYYSSNDLVTTIAEQNAVEYDFITLASNTRHYIWVIAEWEIGESQPVALMADTLGST